jgi:hypothetical protein
MTILFPVDQRSALRAGINAPDSSVKLEVDPGSLSALHCAILADSLEDGYRSSIVLVQPDLAGLMKRLEGLVISMGAA